MSNRGGGRGGAALDKLPAVQAIKLSQHPKEKHKQRQFAAVREANEAYMLNHRPIQGHQGRRCIFDSLKGIREDTCVVIMIDHIT